MEYRFYGAGQDIRFVNRQYEDLDTPEKLYEVFSKVWCRQTCAPRMADDWNEGNRLLVSARSLPSWYRISSAGKCTESN